MGEPSGTADDLVEDRQLLELMHEAYYCWRCLNFDNMLDRLDALDLRKKMNKMKKVKFSNEVTVIGYSETGIKG